MIEAKIFYNTNNVNSNNLNSFASNIKNIGYDKTYLKNIQPHINEINKALSYPLNNLTHSLEGYGFTVINDEMVLGNVSSTSVTFREKYKNLISQEDGDPYIVRNELMKIYNNIKGDDPNFNGYSMKDLLLWATAYIALETGSEYLLNTDAERYERLLKTVKTFIDVNDLEFPEEMTDLDRITKFRVSKKTLDLAKIAGALSSNYNWANSFYVTTHTFAMAKQIINSLYAIYLVEKGKYTDETKRIIFGFDVVSECIIEDYVKALSKISNKNVQNLLEKDDEDALDSITKDYANELRGFKIFNNTNRKIIKKLSELEGYSESEFNQIMDKAEKIKKSLIQCKNGVRNTIKMNTHSMKSQIERHKYYVLSLLSLNCSGHMFGFKTTSIDNRVFNTATKTTRQLRPYTPYQIIQCDIKSAFASFLDTIVGSNISQDVYGNLMKKYNIERSEAKTMYNMMLNDNTRNILEARAFFRACGYTGDQVTKIVNLTSEEKGNFYRTMTKMEEELIKDFKHLNRLDHTAVRLHDAIIMFNTPNNQNLTTKIRNYEFEITIL